MTTRHTFRVAPRYEGAGRFRVDGPDGEFYQVVNPDNTFTIVDSPELAEFYTGSEHVNGDPVVESDEPAEPVKKKKGA